MKNQAHNEDCEGEIVKLDSLPTPLSVCVLLKNSARSRNFKMWISGEGTLTLSKPTRASKSAAFDFLKKNADWVAAHINDVPKSVPLGEYLTKHPHIWTGEKEWKVWLKESRASAFFVEDEKAGEVVFSYEPAAREVSIKKLLESFARARIPSVIDEAAKKSGLEYGRFSVRDQSSRWASRSSSGTLSFNWRALLLCPKLQNYLICHELSHIRFMDHSTAFWIYLNRMCPNARRLDAQLANESEKIFAVGRD